MEKLFGEIGMAMNILSLKCHQCTSLKLGFGKWRVIIHTGVGDEGGFAPDLDGNSSTMEMSEAIAIDVVKAMIHKSSPEEAEALRVILKKAGVEER